MHIEILGELGWNTYMVGKWHLCPSVEMNLASTRRNWPSGRGFERWYGFLGAETNQWYPELVYDNHPVDPPKTPEQGYHFTDDITDKAIEFIQDAKAVAPENPLRSLDSETSFVNRACAVDCVGRHRVAPRTTWSVVRRTPCAAGSRTRETRCFSRSCSTSRPIR